MGKKVILAVAGSGKTYTICHTIDPQKTNLIIAFTRQNVRNIENELIDAFGEIPANTTISTFHSFVYQRFVCPFEPIILDAFGVSDFVRNGVRPMDPPSMRIKRKGRDVLNPKYHPDSSFLHYTCGNDYYCCYISKLIIKANKRANNLLKRAISSIEKLYDHVLIDEFQDFREYDFELLSKLIKGISNITVVGDYFQHSVSGQNNTGKPFLLKKKQLTYDEYINVLENLGMKVDNTSLCKSRRCPQNICDYVKKKLMISIDADNNYCGQVKLLTNFDEIRKVLEDKNVTKLVYHESSKYTFNGVNWGYSKGDTYPDVCVLLTDKLAGLDSPDFNVSSISNIICNKIYVAMTRTKGNLFFVRKSDFDQLKSDFIINRA